MLPDHTHNGKKEWRCSVYSSIRELGATVGPLGIALYVVLLTYAKHDTGECHPSHGTLAADTGMSRRAVIRYLHRLKAAGLILVKQKPGGFCVYKVLPTPGTCATQSQPDTPPTCATQSQGCATVAQGCATQSQPPVPHSHTNINHLNNNQGQSPPTARARRGGESPKRGRGKTPKDPDLFAAVAEATGTDPKLGFAAVEGTCDALRGGEPPYTAADVRRYKQLTEEWGYTTPPGLRQLVNEIGRVRTQPAGTPKRRSARDEQRERERRRHRYDPSEEGPPGGRVP